MNPVVENGIKDMKTTGKMTTKINYYQQTLIKNATAF